MREGHVGPSAAIVSVEELPRGDGRQFVIVQLDMSYLQALRIFRPGTAIRLVQPDGSTFDVRGQLAFVNPVDAPALVTLDMPTAAPVHKGSRLEFSIAK